MIDLKQAVQAAEQFARGLFPQGDLQHFRLEEAERSEDGRDWLITLGWAESGVRVVQGGNLFANAKADVISLPRVYKQFRVDATTGEVASMRIRDV